MSPTWTFGRKLAAGFGVTLAFAALISAIAIWALRGVTTAKDHVITINTRQLLETERLNTLAEAMSSAARAFLLTRDHRFDDAAREDHERFHATLGQLRATAEDDTETRLLDDLAGVEDAHQLATERVMALRRTEVPAEQTTEAWEREIIPTRARMAQLIDAVGARERDHAQARAQAANGMAAKAIWLLIVSTLTAILVVGAIGFVLTRTLTREIGQAVQHVQSSSTELQASANQQAAGSKEQATAMAEIITTVSELLATARQIAESAQRVAQVAGETSNAAGAGDAMVARSAELLAAIRKQVDAIVHQMLDLGRKSQQIGNVVDIINELAEQTNILAINATIEAAGAGDSGRRFGVVADEIRKLADRVSDSTKDVKPLIEEIRAAVNATVMATESGSKAVEAGSRQFVDLAASFRQINELVGTTTEASREIQLSTKQQSSAVEQVTYAITSAAQGARESEASATQTTHTAMQLASLSRGLLKLVQPPIAS